MTTTDEQIGPTLDNALTDTFPIIDQGHPQTAKTRRVAKIMRHVNRYLQNKGYRIQSYNFHEVPEKRHVAFNERRQDKNTTFVSACCIDYRSLRYLSDDALIESIFDNTLAYLRGETQYCLKAKE